MQTHFIFRVVSGRKRRSQDDHFTSHEMKRYQVLGKIEEGIKKYSGLDGHSCMLRMLCETAQVDLLNRFIINELTKNCAPGPVPHRGRHGRLVERAAHSAVHPRSGRSDQEPKRVSVSDPRRKGVGQLLGVRRHVRRVILQGEAKNRSLSLYSRGDTSTYFQINEHPEVNGTSVIYPDFNRTSIIYN